MRSDEPEAPRFPERQVSGTAAPPSGRQGDYGGTGQTAARKVCSAETRYRRDRRRAAPASRHVPWFRETTWGGGERPPLGFEEILIKGKMDVFIAEEVEHGDFTGLNSHAAIQE